MERNGDGRALASGDRWSGGWHGPVEGLAAHSLEQTVGAGTVEIDHHVGGEQRQRHGLVGQASTGDLEEREEARGSRMLTSLQRRARGGRRNPAGEVRRPDGPAGARPSRRLGGRSAGMTSSAWGEEEEAMAREAVVSFGGAWR